MGGKKVEEMVRLNGFSMNLEDIETSESHTVS